jgi:hypothetical protein
MIEMLKEVFVVVRGNLFCGNPVYLEREAKERSSLLTGCCSILDEEKLS